MGKIVLLDELTINKIAAGEVIERPASVVKEMLENSIDAEATNINIEIEGGGIAKIRITDNGKGIEKDDMIIAFERHATSKIRKADDLETVKSMGFRGEALASIAAIAKVEMVSRTANSEVGNRVVVEGGKLLVEEEIGCPIGTTITVENLFFNTPVRYKFLKKDYTESGYIEDAVTRIALINPNIAIKLINTGKTVIQTSGNGDMKSVIYNIYGKEIAEGVLDVEYEYEGIKLKGVVGKPEIARSNKSNQMFFVNKRYVKDKTLSAATEKAFKGMLPIGKFAFLVLDIDLAPNEVDVNVHPAKLEVRFKDENLIFKAVYHALRESLLKGELIANTEKEETIEKSTIPTFDTSIKHEENKIEEKQNEPRSIVSLFKKISKNHEKDENDNIFTPQEQENSVIEELYRKKFEDMYDTKTNEKNSNIDKEEKTNIVSQDTAVYKTEEINNQNNLTQTKVSEIKTDEIKQNEKDVNKEEMPKNFEEMYEKTFGDIPASMKKKEENMKFNAMQYAKEDNVNMFEKNKKYSDYKFVGIAFSTYIMLEIKDELYILDQHAAHERIMYEKVKANFYSENEKDSQLMLVPDVITLTHKDMSIARENMQTFEKAGFMLEEFGDNTIKLTGVPNICMDLDTKQLFLDILDEIDTVARTARQEIEEKFIATVACKAAVKANMSLTKEEVDNLMSELLKLPNPFTCPHGRPTAIKMSKIDIEKKFSRR